MSVKINNETIKQVLDDICSHPVFSNSTVYKRLLSYLVEKALDGEDVKEYTIGNDLFGKNYINDKNDGTVRSYMYKLRKKLTEYYAENTDSSIIFELPKGQYNLHFASKKEQVQDTEEAVVKLPLKTLNWSAIVLSLIIISLLAIKFTGNQKPAIWKDYLSKNANNLVIISDQYIVMEQHSKATKNATMFMEINNDDDLVKYKKEHPERELDRTDFTTMTKMAPFGVKILSEWFLNYKSNFNMQLESRLTYEDIKSNNFIFIGQYKTMNLSESLFLSESKVFTTHKDGFKYKKGSVEKIYNTQRKSIENIEYAMVSFHTQNSGQKALYFVSNNDIGVTATLDKFTNKKWLKDFLSQLPSNESHFNALFEVRGLQRTDVDCELVELEIFQ